jgi:uncharacterized protein
MFEWDENKNQSNIKKHGIDFNIAKEVFNDQDKITTPDKRNDYGEERYKAVGKVFGTIISVIFTFRDELIRLISARKASYKEREQYHNR